MRISLAQAVALRSVLSKQIEDLIDERRSIAVVTVPKGEKYEKPSRNIEQVTAELEEVYDAYRQLDLKMAEANLNHTIEWDNQPLTIMEAIELAKQMRNELSELKSFAARQKQEYSSSWRDHVMVTFALYDPDQYKEKAKKLERKVNRLSYLIEAANHQVFFEFPPAKEYLDE